VNAENIRLRGELTAQASFSCELQEILKGNAEQVHALEATVEQLVGKNVKNITPAVLPCGSNDTPYLGGSSTLPWGQQHPPLGVPDSSTLPWGQTLLQKVKGGSTIEELRRSCLEMQEAVRQCANLWCASLSVYKLTIPIEKCGMRSAETNLSYVAGCSVIIMIMNLLMPVN
jgi:hypothetical protein